MDANLDAENRQGAVLVVQFAQSSSDSFDPGLQHVRLPVVPSPEVCSKNSCPLNTVTAAIPLSHPAAKS